MTRCLYGLRYLGRYLKCISFCVNTNKASREFMPGSLKTGNTNNG